MTTEQIKEIEKIIKIDFKDKDLLLRAFVHRSYLNESQDLSQISNERLEFLGDSILQFLSSEFLYKEFPDFTEGELTNLRAKIVNTQSLAEESAKLGFGEYLLISKGERASATESKHILANTFESVLGALYLDRGMKVCKEFLLRELFPKADMIMQHGILKDYKSLFQEFAQEKFEVTPNYRVLTEIGPDHQKVFEVAVLINDTQVAMGKGTSKRSAQQEAAKNALIDAGELKID